MAAPASTKDLSKAIGNYMSSTETLPLPDDLTEIIQGYLDKHEKYDEGAADRLHEELVSVYQKAVEGNPSRYAAFLSILRQLRPSLKSESRVVEWWDKLVEPVLDHLGLEKGLANEAFANAIDLLTAEGYQDRENADSESQPSPIATRLLNKWMHVFHVTRPEGNAAEIFKEKMMREVLIMFGKRKPQEFMAAVNSFLVQKEFRSRSLTLLCEFVQSQPPRLYLVLKTPLFGNILRCLQVDSSTTVISLALTALIMLLPNMPSSLVDYLPTLFNIYARLLFWDRERSLAIDGTETDVERGDATIPPGWEKCVYAPDTDGLAIPHLLDYFTILYGLYPLNFVDYIRKPQRYLRHANVTNADDIEVQPSEIRDRSERFRQCHMLHPNFYSLTIETEKVDFSRWLKSEPAEVVAECMGLCLASESGPGDDFEAANIPGVSSAHEAKETTKDGPDQAILNGSTLIERSPSRDYRSGTWRHTQSTAGDSSSDGRMQPPSGRRNSQSSHDPSVPSLRDSLEARSRELGADSPTLPPHLVSSSSHTQLQDMINSNKAIKSGLHQSLANDSVPSLALSHQESVPDRTSLKLAATHQPDPSPTSPGYTSGQVSQLYRQILLLNNDLNFERYMKQQHMVHIGDLRRRQVREAATEAEMQNLVMANRNLKYRLEDAKRAELQAKKEAENRRVLAKKWENDLSTKLKVLREEQKKWNLEGPELKRELEAKKEECEKLTKLLCDYETRELNAKQNQQSVDLSVTEIERLKVEVDRLAEAERNYQGKEREMEAALAQAADAVSRTEVLDMKLAARDTEIRQTREFYESQIVVLNTKLQEALKGGRTNQASDANSLVEGALAASRAKQAELQKQYGNLMRKYTVLQSSLLDITVNTHATRPRADGASSSDADAEVSAIMTSPISPVRTRSHRGLSDPEAFEGASYNATPPLDGFGGTSAGTVVHRPVTPPQGTGSGDGSAMARTSPTTERYYGRGGVQNTIRKERKDKKKDEPEKKEKKSTGIRGIRGFG